MPVTPWPDDDELLRIPESVLRALGRRHRLRLLGALGFSVLCSIMAGLLVESVFHHGAGTAAAGLVLAITFLRLRARARNRYASDVWQEAQARG
jgi:hypothetical protein